MLADIVKIHCLIHQTTFPMSRTSRIVVCKEGAEEHVLSNDFPQTGLWIYCCNCQTFIAWQEDLPGISLRECPFCLSSLNPRFYSCDHCAVTMVDFDDPTLRKHHTVLSWGMPQPACPGCHQFPRTTPRSHFCEVIKGFLATARERCPFCRIELAGMAQIEETKAVTAKLDAALAEARVRTQEAESRSRLAEETVRKEIELRVQAERKAEEIEKKATRDLSPPAAPLADGDLPRKEIEAARIKAENEARARAEAEAQAKQAQELRLQAEIAAQHEAERRAEAELHAREMAERYTTDLARAQKQNVQGNRRDRVTIALYAAIATFLTLALIMLITTIVSIYSSNQ